MSQCTRYHAAWLDLEDYFDQIYREYYQKARDYIQKQKNK